MDTNKNRAGRNRTINLTEEERQFYKQHLIYLDKNVDLGQIINTTINQDFFEVVDYLPSNCVDLLFVDPPYNISKQYNEKAFKKMDLFEYVKWIDIWVSKIIRLLKSNSSIYICCDPFSSTAIHTVVDKYFKVRNRITWEREKGRGALANWKSSCEDIWFCTKSDDYVFNLDDVKMKRKVLAPYTHDDGKPKDWERSKDGNYRLTHPSNLWNDITVPFWSMPENTDHPTQKPEKLLAKIILASSNNNDVVLDPFLGSGTTSVVAKKLGRRYIGVEIDEVFSCLAEKRLQTTKDDNTIQGYYDGVFWERNTLNEQKKNEKSSKKA